MVKSNLKNERRVVVTGLGVVSSLGIGWEEFWKNIMAGKSGISKIESFDTSQYDRHYGGEVKNFDPAQFMSRRKAAQIGRASQMAIAASKLALKDAGVELGSLDKRRVAVCVGTTTGEIGLLEKLNDTKINSTKNRIQNATFSIYPASSLSINIARAFGFGGSNVVLGTACASGNYAIGRGLDLIRAGRADSALVGGSDGFSRILFTGFGRLYAIAPEKCQPFDKNRKGMIPGEGAGMLLLETLENAKKRRATIYAEVLGYGLSCDGEHMTNPSFLGIKKAIVKSLRSSNVKATQVSYINAHGTGTIENDAAECTAYNLVFNGQLKNIPVSSIKSMLGHTMGAASALESIACCLTVQCNEVPPTINLSELDKECDIDCVPYKGRRHKIKTVLNNSQAFGGNNGCIVFQKI